MTGPHAQLGLHYIALGGLMAGNAAAYLAEPLIAVMGSSWTSPRDLIKANDWAAPIAHAPEVYALVGAARFSCGRVETALAAEVRGGGAEFVFESAAEGGHFGETAGVADSGEFRVRIGEHLQGALEAKVVEGELRRGLQAAVEEATQVRRGNMHRGGDFFEARVRRQTRLILGKGLVHALPVRVGPGRGAAHGRLVNEQAQGGQDMVGA